MDSFTDLLEGPGGFGLGRLLGRLPRVAVALAGRADADLLLVGTVAAVTAGAHVVDRLQGGGGKKSSRRSIHKRCKDSHLFLPQSSVCPYLKQQPVNLLADFLYVRVHDLPAVVRCRGKDIFVHGTPETTGRRVTEPA